MPFGGSYLLMHVCILKVTKYYTSVTIPYAVCPPCEFHFFTHSFWVPYRGSVGLSPPVTLMAPLADECVDGRQPKEGWQGVTEDKDDEVELMYDTTLNCFYDPKTCKYYVLQ